MRSLKTAIYTRFAASPHNAFHTAVGGRLYDTQAPENAPKPHAIYQTFGVATHLMDMWTVQFTLVFPDSLSSGPISDAYAALIALYDDCDLPGVGSPGNLGMERTAQSCTREGGLWIYLVEYSIWIAKL